MKLLPSWESLRKRLCPLLKSLDAEARLVAIEVCFAYRTRASFQEDQGVVAEQQKQLRAAGLRSIRRLRYFAKCLAELRSQVECLCDPVRRAQIPITIYDLVPSDVESTLTAEHFRWREMDDPAQPYLDFVRSIDFMQGLVDPQIVQFQKYVTSMRKGWRYPVNPFWKTGCLEYVLMRLFKERAGGKVHAGKAQQLTAEILTMLDGGARTPDAVRIAAKRVRTVPESQRLRLACDAFLKYRSSVPHQH